MAKGKKTSYWDEQSRLTRHKADIAEMDSKKLAGELVTIDEVDSVFGKLVTAVRQRFLGLGTRLAPILTNKSPAFIKREIDAVIYEALNEFGTYFPESGELLTSVKEFHKLRISELTARVLDDLETDLPNMSPDQKIKLLGMLQKANEKYEEKEDNKITGLLGLLTAIDEEGKNQKACLNPTPGPRI